MTGDRQAKANISSFTLDEEAAKKIISTPRTILNETDVFNDMRHSKSERIANAKRILDSRKEK
ncbi:MULTISPECIES: hypothetical protein [Bacillaceae]|uniref:Uncharacterized protein n=1 Tax=Evansella alkalicola TaxID=745819 RepID=A0ABS6JY14_9BACI|nr:MULTISPECIES: hypothetical protein [Bacillaceae]MBU9723127.1 hypothetical protein [Bacillus alkalicola]